MSGPVSTVTGKTQANNLFCKVQKGLKISLTITMTCICIDFYQETIKFKCADRSMETQRLQGQSAINRAHWDT